LQSLNVEFQHIEAQDADLIYDALIDGQPAIVHLELQSDNHPRMLNRMLRYLVDIYAAYQRPVYQCVVYLGAKPVNMIRTLGFSLSQESRIEYRYHILALNQLPFADVAQMEPLDFLALLPLTHSDWDAATHLANSIDVVTKRSQVMDFESRSNLLLKTEVLAGLRFERTLIEKLCKEAMDMFQIEQSSTYQMILEKGFEKGVQQGLQQGVQQGVQQGIEQGHQLGLKAGKEEGLLQGIQTAIQKFQSKIIDILQKRFVTLPVSAVQEVKAIQDLDQLDVALSNALEAESLALFLETLKS
jgi:predicted transposase/invertase (TIGR01784 family)